MYGGQEREEELNKDERVELEKKGGRGQKREEGKGRGR